MKDKSKIKYNLIVGIVGQIVSIVLGVVLPKLVMTSYGSEVNGLLSSVTNIYAYIAIVESGIAAASCQALYNPIAENARDKINRVLSATNRYYRRTGLIYFGLVLLFAAIYPVSIQTEIPYYKIAAIVLFNGIGNVINYFFHGKYLILLKADGKNYIRTGMEMLTNAAKQILKILLIGWGFDVVSVQMVAMAVSFAQMAYITWYIKKNYAWIDLKAEPDFHSLSHNKNALIHEINYLITANVDTVLLTYFAGLKTVSVYALYNLLYGVVNRMLRVVRDSVEYKIANLFFGDRKQFDSVYDVFEIYYITLAFALFTITNYFVLPFISVYTRGVHDIDYVQNSLPILFTLTGVIAAGGYPASAMIHISGHYQQTQKFAVIDSVINLLVSIPLTYRFGIVGALTGTIVALLFHACCLIQYVNKHILERNPLETYKCCCVNFALFFTITYLNRFLVIRLDSYVRIFAFCVPYAFCVLLVYFGIVSLLEPKAFRCAARLLRKSR